MATKPEFRQTRSEERVQQILKPKEQTQKLMRVRERVKQATATKMSITSPDAHARFTSWYEATSTLRSFVCTSPNRSTSRENV